MSKLDVIREIAAIMEENGYTLVRSKRHDVWFNGRDTVVTAQSPSDRRAIKNIRALMRRKNAANPQERKTELHTVSPSH